MNARRILMLILAVGCTATLNSCIFQQIASRFVRDVYPGDCPPHVIADINGKPEHTRWIKANPNDLPPSGYLHGKVEYAEDGLPYSLPCEFSDILVSPYAPNYQLDYTNCEAGQKVWDPYTRKAFYINRHYTIN